MKPISKEPTIRAYGLETRYYTHDPKRGYGCAECCNGDRCDEDCTVKYKGNRAGCPHCKGKGWIKAEDLDQALPALSKELSEQIERGAETYANTKNANKTVIRLAYTAGATAYAHYKERWEQTKKALEDIMAKEGVNYLLPEQVSIKINALLASWKEEGKEGDV